MYLLIPTLLPNAAAGSENFFPRGHYPILIDGVGGREYPRTAAWTFVYANDQQGQRVSNNSYSNRYLHCRGRLESTAGHDTTNTRAALFAANQTLRLRHDIFHEIFPSSKMPRVLVLTTSHNYVAQNAGAVAGWEEGGWLKRNGEPPLNVDLWKLFLEERNACEQDGVEVEFELMDLKNARVNICRRIVFEEYDADDSASST